jgi:DNA-binding response OmpR family regulator
VLEVSLRKAGFSVTPAVSVGDALDKLEIHAPDLIISETKFATELDGFELRRRLRASPAWADIPFIFLTAETAIESKIKGLELGVDDYLTKPIYIKEIVTRINILLQKRQRQFLDLKKDGTRFAGRVADMPVVDVIQTIEISRKSGVIQFTGGPNRQAAIYFRDGKVIDAEAGTLQGEDAVYRLLTWNEGEFEVEFRTVRRREAITTSSQGLLMEGMRRLDEWSRLLEQLPPLSHRFEIDAAELAQRLGEIPDDNNRILRLFDGKRTLLEVIDASDFGDLECLHAISRLYFEGLLIDLDPGVRTKRDTGRPMPLTVVDGAPGTPIEEVVSEPIDVAGLSERAEHSATSDTHAPTLGEAAQDSTAPAEVAAPSPVQTVADAVASPPRARRDWSQGIEDADVLEEEEIRGPLTGGYRPSSLRLIDEAVAAAQAIEPTLFEPEELAAAGLAPAALPPAGDADKPLARMKAAAKPSDPRIENARELIERTPALAEPSEPPGQNGESPRRKVPTKPPPIPVKAAPSEREIADAPLLDADPYTSGEHPVPSEREIADAPLLDADPYTSGEHPTKEIEAEDSSGVPTTVESDEGNGLADEGPTDPSRRPFPAPVRREESHGLRMIGSHGRDRAEASGELRPPPPKPPPPSETGERELVTILPRRITREIAIQTPDGELPAEPKVQTSLAIETADTTPRIEVKPGKPAVEPPPRPPPPRVSVEGGVVRDAGPGRLAKVLIGVAAVLAGATVYTKFKQPKQAQQATVTYEDAAVVALAPDASEALAVAIDAGSPPADAAVATVARPDAAVVATARRDAGIATPRPDAAVAAPAPAADAGIDKAKEAKLLAEQGHEALEDGDPETALALLDQSLALRKTARTYLERARALQRMNRIDEAVASIDSAIKMNISYAPAYEQKGMLLWSAQRYAEARPVLQKYLELEPDGRKAPMIRSMLDEPR